MYKASLSELPTECAKDDHEFKITAYQKGIIYYRCKNCDILSEEPIYSGKTFGHKSNWKVSREVF